MKKVERINVIMRYINNRAHFTLTEIMREFNISRSKEPTPIIPTCLICQICPIPCWSN